MRPDSWVGRLHRAAGYDWRAFGRELERSPIPSACYYKPGTALCSLTLSGKFVLFAQDTFDPIALISSGFNAGIGHTQDSDPFYGQAAQGYRSTPSGRYI